MRLALSATTVALVASALQAQGPAPTSLLQPSPPPMAMIEASDPIDAYYAAHPGPLWLRDADTRAAAAKLADQLRHSGMEGFEEGPKLAATVDTALTSGQAADERAIASAWVRYVQMLNRPVKGIEYAEPHLNLKAPSPAAILEAAAKAPSLTDHIAQATALNPFYEALRASAIKAGLEADQRVRSSLDRLRVVPSKGRVLLADVANAELLLLEDGRVADRMKIIVGKRDAQTPLLASKIYYVTLNPYWHIPPDVTQRKVAPIVLKRGTSYLKAARYEAVAAFGGESEQPIDPDTVDWKAVAAGDVTAHIRQLAGPNNMMGHMKFGFANEYGVYLHDTPHKELFAKAKRTLSLGCVRVEQPERLATWLLGHEPGPPTDDFEKLVQLDSGVPIYILYLTARPDADTVAFADDVYGLDRESPAVIAANAPQEGDKSPAN